MNIEMFKITIWGKLVALPQKSVWAFVTEGDVYMSPCSHNPPKKSKAWLCTEALAEQLFGERHACPHVGDTARYVGGFDDQAGFTVYTGGLEDSVNVYSCSVCGFKQYGPGGNARFQAAMGNTPRYTHPAHSYHTGEGRIELTRISVEKSLDWGRTKFGIDCEPESTGRVVFVKGSVSNRLLAKHFPHAIDMRLIVGDYYVLVEK